MRNPLFIALFTVSYRSFDVRFLCRWIYFLLMTRKKRRTCRWWIIPFLVLKISIRLSHKYFLVLECVGLIVLFFLFNLRRERGGGVWLKIQNHLSFLFSCFFFASSFKETVDINMSNKTRICLSIIDIESILLLFFVCIGRSLMFIQGKWCKWE